MQSSLQNDPTGPEDGPVALAIAEHPCALQGVLQEKPLHGDDKEN